MYDELVKRLRICPDYNDGCVNCQHEHDLGCRTTTMREAADAIEELSKPRWIPVTERLPEDDCNCIVFSDGYVKESHFYFGTFLDPIEDYMQYKPTHWMPLPEPPKEE